MAAVVALAACGSEPQGNSAPSPQSDRPGFGHDADRYGKPSSQAPQAHIPSGPPPKRLTFKELRPGTGPAVERGDEAIVNYVGHHYSTKKRYDTSYGLNPRPYKVYPGQGDFIDGFEEGIIGMRVHGRRQVTIPPDKAYGKRGFTGQVKPNETLVFVIDLEALDKR